MTQLLLASQSSGRAAMLRAAGLDFETTAAHVDEDWNMATWGEDSAAMERRAFRLSEFAAAAEVLRHLRTA